MEVRLLGPTAVSVAGTGVDLGGPKQHALLAVLALYRGEAVSTGTLLEALWGEDAPPSATATLHGYIYTLRRALDPARAARQPSSVVVTTPTGYALHLPGDVLDTDRLAAVVRRAAAAVPAATERPWEPQGDPAELAGLRAELVEALAGWRGEPYADLDGFLPAVAERVRLGDLRDEAVELAAALALAAGDLAEAATQVEGLIAEHPHRERPRLLRAVALVRMGRQVEALASLRKYREALADELGLDPGPVVRELETAILQQDPDLQARAHREGDRSPAVATDPRPEPDAWPLVGRAHEQALLDRALDAAENGVVRLVQLIGDPGIGKSRLMRHVVREAAHRGFVCAEASCSQDEGAPPLWPWLSILDGLAVGTGVPVPDVRRVEGAQFALWQAITDAVTAAAAERPVLIAVDDIHWADPSTLRALRHLVEAARRGRILLVTSRRTFPAPVDAQAALADALARRHALRIELTGLDETAATELVCSISAARRTEHDLARLQARTEGNPFFLVELARADGTIPGSVRDVVARRVDELPRATREVLATAAVIGRRFRLDALAGAQDADEAAVVDELLPALATGLVLDTEGPTAVRFSHPLVQDVVINQMPAIQRAALHVRVARALAGLPEVAASDLARHWREAGPRHAPETADAAERAAAVARAVAAYEEEVELLGWAVEARRTMPGTDDRVLYELEMARARAGRWGGQWSVAEEAVAAAVELADRLGDHEALARAVLSTVEGAVWYSNPFGDVNAFVVDTLERVLSGLPRDDSEMRCRVLLSLGVELYFTAEPERVAAYIDDAVAMARRIGDPVLLQGVLHGACFGNWLPASTVARASLASEAVTLAESTGDRRALALALAGEASALAELGEVDRMWPVIDRGLAVADELNLTAVTVFIEAMRLPWLVLGGDREHGRAALPRLRELASRVAIPNVAAALAHTALVTGLVDEAADESSAAEQVLEAASVPTVSAHAVVYVRRGDPATARRIVETFRERFLEDHLDFMSMMRWCYGAELGLALGDAELAALSDAALAPYSGRSCSAAQIGADGPVDLYRALAAAGVGDLDRAASLADEAQRQCEAWDVPVAGARLAGYRRDHGF